MLSFSRGDQARLDRSEVLQRDFLGLAFVLAEQKILLWEVFATHRRDSLLVLQTRITLGFPLCGLKRISALVKRRGDLSVLLSGIWQILNGNNAASGHR